MSERSRSVPSPRALLLDLVAWKLGMFLLGAIVVVCIEQLAFPTPRAFRDIAPVPVAVVGAMCLVAGLVVQRPWRALLRLRPYVLASAERLAAPPVDPDDIVAVHELPGRCASAAALALTLLVGFDVLSGGALTGHSGLEAAAFDLMMFGVLQAAVSVTFILWRTSLWSWTRHIDPRDFPAERMRRVLAQRFAGRIGSVLVLLACISLSFPLAFLARDSVVAERPQALLFFVGALGVTAVAVLGGTWLAHRLGRRLATDVAELTVFVGRLRDAVRTQQPHPVDAPEPRTPNASALAARIVELSARYSTLLQAEVEARTNIETTQVLKRRFMAHMSHDLRSPLNSIAGFAEILAGSESPLNGEQIRSVRAIRRAGQDLVQLVTEIVDTARVEAGRMELVVEPTDFEHVIGEALEIVRARQEEALRISISISGELPPLALDAQRTAQAISGVLLHVTRMAPDGGVVLEAGKLPDTADAGRFVQVEIVAEDLPPEDTQRMFLAFRELREPSGRRVGGLGLGMALARRLMTAQAGDLAYDKDGGRFRFLFPVAEEVDAEADVDAIGH